MEGGDQSRDIQPLSMFPAGSELGREAGSSFSAYLHQLLTLVGEEPRLFQ